MITISKTLIEVILAIASLLVLGISGAFLATMRAQLVMAKIQLEVRSDRQEFARKVQQNIDSNRVDIGILKGEVADIKGVLERERGMKKRQEFPEENKPPHTDFT